MSEMRGSIILARRGEIAREAMDRELSASGIRGRPKDERAHNSGVEDAEHHLRYLAQALAADDARLFLDYVDWARVLLESRRTPAALFAAHLSFIREVLREQVAPEESVPAAEMIDRAVAELAGSRSEPSEFIIGDSGRASLARQYLALLLEGKRHLAAELVRDSLAHGVPVKDLYLEVFAPAQMELGRLWQLNRISVAQEHYASAATQLVMSQCYPHIFNSERVGRTLVATCVSDELHEIGLRMVSDFFEMEGWDTYYLGANAPAADIVRALVEHQADLLAVSATITPHIADVSSLVDAVRTESACAEVKIIVGGYPFNISAGLWQAVGADGFAENAARATELGSRLLSA